MEISLNVHVGLRILYDAIQFSVRLSCHNNNFFIFFPTVFGNSLNSPHQAKATQGHIMSTTIETITVTRPMKVRNQWF